MKLNFVKTHTDLDESKFEFTYMGECSWIDCTNTKRLENRKDDLKLIQDMLDDFIDNYPHNDTLKNIAFLRTILKDFDEIKFSVTYESSKGVESVIYKNGNLVYFEKTVKDIEEDYTVKYNPIANGSNFDFSLTNSKRDVCDYSCSSNMGEVVTNLVNYIAHLKTVDAIELDVEDNAIVEIYNLFYGKEPNFRDKDINLQIQAMMGILLQFNICLGDDYAYDIHPGICIPVSYKLEDKVEKLYPFGKIKSDKKPVITERNRQIIKIVGEKIMACANNLPENERNDMFVGLARIMHASHYDAILNKDVEDISKFCQRNTTEVESCMKLIRTINDEIDRTHDKEN